jgi:hypothetical protein
MSRMVVGAGSQVRALLVLGSVGVDSTAHA